MIVVSDAGPIHYLVLIGEERLLPTLFGEVLLPPEVLRELRETNAPERVKNWAGHLPSWVTVRMPLATLPDMKLDPGETEAIALCKELDGLLLTDDKRGARIARAESILTFGTLGVLQRAHALSLIEIDQCLEALRKTNYRHTTALFDRVREQAHEMRLKGSTSRHDLDPKVDP